MLDAGLPVAGATVISGLEQATTDASGIAVLTLPAGAVAVVATRQGYKPTSRRVTVVAGEERAIRLTIGPLPETHEGVTAVTSTRNNRRIDEQALPVHVTNRAAIDQQMPMTPGSI